MAVELSTKPNVAAPDSTWIYGKTKDRTSPAVSDGTPLTHAVMSDYFQFFAKMFAESGLTYNTLLDNATNGFQYFDALKSVIGQYKTIDLYAVNTVLTDAAYGAFSVSYVNADRTITLPAITADKVKQKITIHKIGTGTCSVVPDVSDVIQYSPEIFLSAEDTVVLVSYSPGVWFVESKTKAAEKPIFVHTTNAVSLTEKHLGCLNIINYAGNANYTLPPSDTLSSGQLIIIQKQQGGIATILPDYSDTIYPSNTIKLDDGDCIILESTFGVGWVVVSHFDASMFSPQAWHYVGGTFEPAFQNTWINKSGQPAEAAMRFRINTIDGTDYLCISGYLDNATIGSNFSIFTLPTGYRPKWDTPIVIIEEGSVINFHHILIRSNGDVNFSPIGGTYAASGTFYTQFNAMIPLD